MGVSRYYMRCSTGDWWSSILILNLQRWKHLKYPVNICSLISPTASIKHLASFYWTWSCCQTTYIVCTHRKGKCTRMQYKTMLYMCKLDISQEVPGTSQEFQDLEPQECSYVTRGGIPGSPMNIPSVNWDYSSVAVTQGEVPGTSQDFHNLGLHEYSCY